MAEAFAEAVLSGKPVPYPPEDAVDNMRALDAIARFGALRTARRDQVDVNMASQMPAKQMPAKPAAAFSHLFSPFRIRDVALKNRIVFQPHFTALGNLDGMGSDDHDRLSRGARARRHRAHRHREPGGASDRQDVAPLHHRLGPGGHPLLPQADRERSGARHEDLRPAHPWRPHLARAPAAHTVGALADARAVEPFLHQGDGCRGHRGDGIDGFAASARNAMEGGFDGVEIKVAHDGLLRSFASPFFNHRTDGYGGSFENRMRFSIEVLEAIKRATATDFPVGVRICLDEFTHLRLRARLRAEDGRRARAHAAASTISMPTPAPSPATGWRSRRPPSLPAASAG